MNPSLGGATLRPDLRQSMENMPFKQQVRQRAELTFLRLLFSQFLARAKSENWVAMQFLPKDAMHHLKDRVLLHKHCAAVVPVPVCLLTKLV